MLRNPKIVISAVVGIALLATLVGASGAGKVAGVLAHLKPVYALGFVLLMVVYEAVRGVQWHMLLKGLAVEVPIRAEVFSYMWGEATKAAPAGNYFQNYLLGRLENEDFSKTSAATTLVVLTEIAWGLLMVAAIQIDGWTWLRPLILIGASLIIALTALSFKLIHKCTPVELLRSKGKTAAILDAIGRLREGLAVLARPRMLAAQAVLGGSYICCAGVGLFVLAIGLGVDNVSLLQIVGIYAFTMTVGLLMPLPIDFGVIEISGVGALLASGISQEVAVALMLLNRVLNLGAAIAIAAVATLFFREELHRALRSQHP